MTSELGDAEDKYRRKIDEEDDLILSSQDIRDINDGKTVIKEIPIKFNPQISYSGLGGGEGEGEGGKGHGESKNKLRISVDAIKLRQMMENWGLDFTKPGKKNKKLYTLITTENGIQENQEKTIEAMLERQFATGYFEKNGFKIDVRDEDLRYYLIEEKTIPNLSATFIIIRDVSGSMQQYSEFSATLASLIEFWLRQKYENMVTIRYVAHTDTAIEFDPRRREDFFKIASDGGTAFKPAYELVNNMLEGKPYDSQNPYKETIDYNSEDVFILHITDGENMDNDKDGLNSLMKILFPKLTKVFYLEVGDKASLNSYSDTFYQTITSLNYENVKAVKSSNDISYSNVKKVLDKLLS